jgi:large subunit ribosomal protein L29
MDATEMRGKTPDELRTRLADLKKEAFNLRFRQATSQLENTARMRAVRRETARVMTILNEKARGASETQTTEA